MFLDIAAMVIFSFLVSYFFTPLTIKIANKFSLVDDPKTRSHPAHTHLGIIPRAGGISLFLGISIPSLLILRDSRLIFGIITVLFILMLVGLWDDKKDRSPYIRFTIICLTALLAVIIGIRIPYITNPLAGGVIRLDNLAVSFNLLGISTVITAADFIAFIWILWTTNIIGWSGGVDGQLPGFVAIASIVIGLLSLRFAALDPQQLVVTYLSFITAGSFLGFLPWNFFPQKIMPGYGGKTIAGFMLAVLSILAFSKLGTALLVLIIPMTDAFFTLFKRLLAKKSLVLPSRDHLHHHLLSLGWSKKKVAIFYWIISAIIGALALQLDAKQKIFAGAVFAVILCGFFISLTFWDKLRTNLEDSQ